VTGPLLPDPADPVSGPFWEAARNRRLVVQRCLNCGRLRYPPLVGCPDCLSRPAEWTELRPEGTIWSYAVYHRALHAAFDGDPPYTVAVVELDDGPRIAARLAPPGAEAAVGARVVAGFEDVSDTVTLLRWHLADDAERAGGAEREDDHQS
jgi:uncharacterized protein